MLNVIYSGGVTNEMLISGSRPILLDLETSNVSRPHEAPSKRGLCQVGLTFGFAMLKLGLLETFIDAAKCEVSIDIPEDICARINCNQKGVNEILKALTHINEVYFSVNSRIQSSIKDTNVTYQNGVKAPLNLVGGLIIDIGIDCGSYYNKIC